MNKELISQLYGTDINKEISLFEYGLLIAPYKDDGNEDEYFVVFEVEPGRFDTGFIREKFLNDLINGQEWASSEAIKSFLETHDITKGEWMKLDMSFKLQDCIGEWGYLDIIGDSHHSIDANEARELYLSE